MKPRVDLTKTSRFTIWESGGWDASRKPVSGSSVIVAGPDGEKLKVAFDVNPRENITQCAFFAEIGQVLAACYISSSKHDKVTMTLELARIEQLTTEIVQGEARAIPKLKTLFVHRESTSSDPENIRKMVSTSYDPDKEGNRPEYLMLLKTAVDKAMCPLANQTFFWAIPRVPSAT